MIGPPMVKPNWLLRIGCLRLPTGRDRLDGREEFVAVVEEHVAVNLVGAGLHDHVLVGAGVPAVVRFALALDRELVDGLDGDEAAGHTGDTALIGGHDPEPQVDVIHAVYLVVDGGASVR